jgi:4-aminobutyrate aminotransferase-like enzyme
VNGGLAGDELPRVAGPLPGAVSAAFAARLARVESPNVTRLEPAPIFWPDARGAAVRDADGNIFIDLTAGFGVAHAGHANTAVAAAIAEQAARLAHGLGDVYPPEPKLRLLERLATIAPGELRVGILGSSGAEAVEAALKTAVMRTRRTGIVAFEGAYHGLTYGALATTARADCRTPFAAQLFSGVAFAPYPHREADLVPALERVERLLHADGDGPAVGAVIVEPILGRGGIVLPPAGFLQGLRRLCDGDRGLLIFDEIYTGCGRTGRWFACEHEDVVPDVLCLGKALTGSVALSAALGTPDAMRGWPPSTGEAIHTSTFLGNPIACAAALAQLDASSRLMQRTTLLGERIRDRAAVWARVHGTGAARGRGLVLGVPVPGRGRAVRVSEACLQEGVIVLAEGEEAGVLALTPPAVITDAQLDCALAAIERAIETSA